MASLHPLEACKDDRVVYRRLVRVKLFRLALLAGSLGDEGTYRFR
jgi:hypothetical protein